MTLLRRKIPQAGEVTFRQLPSNVGDVSASDAFPPGNSVDRTVAHL